MKINQAGLAITGSLIILAVIGLVGGTGLYVYKSRGDSKQPLTSVSTQKTNSTITAQDQSSTSVETVAEKNPGFVTIGEWGVAVRLGSASNAEKLTYRIAKDDQGDDTAYLLVKDVPENCREVGFALHRKTSGGNDKYVKIGNGFYAPSAAPISLCDKSPGQEKTAELLTQIGESINDLDYEVKASN